MTEDQEFDTQAGRPSKSARKREDQDLQELAATLLALPAVDLARIPLDPALGIALEATRAITQREARRRQLQYLGTLMRKTNHLEIRTALATLQAHHRQFRQHLERINRLCDDLLTEGDPAINALFEEAEASAALDRQQLRQLVRNASRPTVSETARRKLFDYLRQQLL